MTLPYVVLAATLVLVLVINGVTVYLVHRSIGAFVKRAVIGDTTVHVNGDISEGVQRAADAIARANRATFRGRG